MSKVPSSIDYIVYTDFRETHKLNILFQKICHLHTILANYLPSEYNKYQN